MSQNTLLLKESIKKLKQHNSSHHEKVNDQNNHYKKIQMHTAGLQLN